MFSSLSFLLPSATNTGLHASVPSALCWAVFQPCVEGIQFTKERDINKGHTFLVSELNQLSEKSDE